MTEQHRATDEAARVPLPQKVAFGIGMLGNQMFPAALGVFMVVLVKGLGLSPMLWGILFFLPRLSDALTDPIMGFISDNTKSRWGRRRPYILVGAIIAGVSYIFMWQLSTENSNIYNFWYFLLVALVFYLGMTIFSTPYVAMGYEMSNDFHERTRLMAVAQWIGQWAWVIVPWFWVIIYDPDSIARFGDWIGWAAGATSFLGSLVDGPDPVAVARKLAVWVGLGCLLLAVVPALFCKTQPVDPATLEEISARNIGKNFSSLLRGIGATLRCRPFRQICLATFFVFNAFNTVAGLSWFIIVYYMNNGDTAAAWIWPSLFGAASALATCFVVIPIITWMSQKLGKKNTFLLSQGISVVGYANFWWCFNPEHPWMMLLPLPLFSFGIGGLFTLMMSMTADVCDLDELNTGARREGAFSAVYWWMVKFGFAIAGLGQGVILGLVGFDGGVDAQTPGTLAGLRLAYIIVPATGTLIAMGVMWRYDITEERSREIRRLIVERKHAAGIGQGGASEPSGPEPGSDAPDR